MNPPASRSPRALLAVALLVVATLLAGCTGDDVPNASGPAGVGCNKWLKAPVAYPQPVVVLVTSLGVIEAEICQDAVPVTAENFLAHVRSGVYDGTTFHRIITDFMMQGGDPNSKDPDPANDGQGGAGDEIPDEFHYKLRHDGKGVLSMANRGPNTGTSQFFITFDATPHLDDAHAVFGQVIRGMDVVDAVEKLGSATGTPSKTVTLEKATVREPDEAEQEAAAADGELELWSPDAMHAVGASGGSTEFILVVESTANHLVEAKASAEGPEGITIGLEREFATFPLPAFQRVAFLVDVVVKGEATDNGTISVTVTAGNASATETLVVEKNEAVGPETVEEGEEVRANYIGMMIDGRVFDTSVSAVATNEKIPKHTCFRPHPPYNPFTFTPGSGVIQGFTDLAVGMQEGGKGADRIPPERAYGTARGQSCAQGATVATMAGKALIFQLEVIEITQSA